MNLTVVRGTCWGESSICMAFDVAARTSWLGARTANANRPPSSSLEYVCLLVNLIALLIALLNISTSYNSLVITTFFTLTGLLSLTLSIYARKYLCTIIYILPETILVPFISLWNLCTFLLCASERNGQKRAPGDFPTSGNWYRIEGKHCGSPLSTCGLTTFQGGDIHHMFLSSLKPRWENILLELSQNVANDW